MITRISLVPDRSIAPKQDTSGCQLFFGVETSATSLCSKPVLRVPEHVQIPECFARMLQPVTPVKESSSVIRERQWAEREADGSRDPGQSKKPQKNLFDELLEAKAIISAVRSNRKRTAEMERLRESLTCDGVPLSEVAAIINKRFFGN